jgi:hypothetical protein
LLRSKRCSFQELLRSKLSRPALLRRELLRPSVRQQHCARRRFQASARNCVGERLRTCGRVIPKRHARKSRALPAWRGRATDSLGSVPPHCRLPGGERFLDREKLRR